MSKWPVSKLRVVGHPRHISTSYVERQNLTLRMQQRRFTRLTNAFSKKLENHAAAVALYAMAFNFCRVHEALRVTPAMQLGVTDHIWSIGELVDAVLSNGAPKPGGRQAGPFRIIQGGRAYSWNFHFHGEPGPTSIQISLGGLFKGRR